MPLCTRAGGIHVQAQGLQHVDDANPMLGRHVLLAVHDHAGAGGCRHDAGGRAHHEVLGAPVIGAADIQQAARLRVDVDGMGAQGIGEAKQLVRGLALVALQ